MRAILAILALTVLLPATARSQSGDLLDAAELAADAGDIETARRRLREWLASSDAAASDAPVGRALVLRARLATSADSAEVDYLEAAIRGGETHGSLARLRLAQLRFMRGRPELASTDLQRLRADFPGSPLVAESWLWSGFSAEALGDLDAACAAWTRVEEGAARDSLTEQARRALRACPGGAGTAGVATARYAVQLGAFGTREAAQQISSRASASGVETRILASDASTPLFRVRAGIFLRKEDAARLAVRLRSEGFEAIVVPEVDP